MHFGAQSRGLRTPCERFAPWVTPGPRITRFRLVADLGRMGLDTHRVSNKVSKGSVSYCVQKLLRKESGHGKRLIVKVDLLTKE